jgi:hypothetical protein
MVALSFSRSLPREDPRFFSTLQAGDPGLLARGRDAPGMAIRILPAQKLSLYSASINRCDTPRTLSLERLPGWVRFGDHPASLALVLVVTV